MITFAFKAFRTKLSSTAINQHFAYNANRVQLTDRRHLTSDAAATFQDSHQFAPPVTRGSGAGATTESGTYDAQDGLLTCAGHAYT